jgi:magnesium chelatase subunit D
MEGAHPVWARACLALRLLAADPSGLGGMLIRARAGPVRDAFLALLPEGARRIHPGIQDDQLFGGIDLNATLTQGVLVQHRGIADRGDPIILTMAERTSPALAVRLAGLMDRQDASAVFALDEGVDADEAPPFALVDRLAFHVNLGELNLRDIREIPASETDKVPPGSLSHEQIDQIANVAEAFGVTSLRAVLFTMRAAQVSAGLNRRGAVVSDDIEAAIALVLIPRATRVPQTSEEEAPPPDAEPPDAQDGDDDGPSQTPDQLPEDMLIAAAKALLPPDLLASLAQRKERTAQGSGSGAARTGNRRGRPLPSRPGRLDGQARIDLIATLRSAAPWQRLRREIAPHRKGILIYPSDIHLKRYEEKSDRLLIFVVDASGSAAMTRLAEAKGAVEMMLGAAYARRDHVSLIAFRGETAEVLLPPTRSLVRTKRLLAALPGGGGTPLALGLQEALAMAHLARQKGMSPTVALLTDGRANIALDGTPNRAQAATDASLLARQLRSSRVDSIVIDMGRRPEATLATLAGELGGQYLALPMANAQTISAAVNTQLDS